MLPKPYIEILHRCLSFWDRLTVQQREHMERYAAIREYNKGDIIHDADYECVGMLLVTSGTLRVYILSEDGREITLYRIGTGEICVLSASCVLRSITFDVHIDAASPCTVIQVGSAFIYNIMEENIYVENYIYKLAAERFSDVMWAMQQILFMSFDKRLALFLLNESDASCSDELRMTHEEIARLTGSAREVVTRMLNYFSQEGYVKLSRGKVILLDKTNLRKLL